MRTSHTLSSRRTGPDDDDACCDDAVDLEKPTPEEVEAAAAEFAASPLRAARYAKEPALPKLAVLRAELSQAEDSVNTL